MNKSRIQLIRSAALACALIIGFAACEKSPPAAPTPDLAPPGRPEKIAAQSEVKASSGPVELSLLLYKTEIRLGESLWNKIRIRNVGSRELVVSDPIFYDPWQMRRGVRTGVGIFIEVLGPDGKLLPGDPHPNWGGGDVDVSDKPSGLLEVHGAEERAMLDGWKKSGLSLEQINQKLADFNLKKARDSESQQELPKLKLLPGESAETKSWFMYREWERFKKRPRPIPIGDFAELDFFDLDKPGEYKVRAVYDRAPSKWLMEARGKIPVEPDEVLVRTPWVRITVLP